MYLMRTRGGIASFEATSAFILLSCLVRVSLTSRVKNTQRFYYDLLFGRYLHDEQCLLPDHARDRFFPVWSVSDEEAAGAAHRARLESSGGAGTWLV